MAHQHWAYEVHLAEYDRLKQEQLVRIGMRDNLLYATLAVAVSTVAISLSGATGRAVLLALPLVCVVLGWTYLVNDQKVSAIGRYLRHDLAEHLAAHCDARAGSLLRWETVHRGDRDRRRRKTGQILVDLLAFCLTGALAIAGYLLLAGSVAWPVIILCTAEAATLAVLGFELVRQTDRSTGG